MKFTGIPRLGLQWTSYTYTHTWTAMTYIHPPTLRLYSPIYIYPHLDCIDLHTYTHTWPAWTSYAYNHTWTAMTFIHIYPHLDSNDLHAHTPTLGLQWPSCTCTSVCLSICLSVHTLHHCNISSKQRWRIVIGHLFIPRSLSKGNDIDPYFREKWNQNLEII